MEGPDEQSTGLRTNGLDAPSFHLLAEVDPRIAVELLRLLAQQGIAAYSQPSSGTTGAYLNRRLPSRPVDSFYVDADQLSRARGIVEPVISQRNAQTEAEAFEAIVAGLREELSELDTSEPPAPDEQGGPATPLYTIRGDGPRDFQLRAEDEHYTPPAPRKRGPLHTTTKWALCSLGLGLVLLVFPWLLGIDGGDGTVFVGVLGILLGTGLLITRLRDDRIDPGDFDDGAVV